jgi:hypothetical protein
MNTTASTRSSRYERSMTLMNMVSSLTGFMSKKTTKGMFLPKLYFCTKPICHRIILWSGSHFLRLIMNVNMKLIFLQDGRCRCCHLDYPTFIRALIEHTIYCPETPPSIMAIYIVMRYDIYAIAIRSQHVS